MKKLLIILCAALCLAIGLTGCSNAAGGDSDETYIVWTSVDSYTDFQSAFNTTLNDGMYMHAEFNSEGWSQISPLLPNDEDKHDWSQDKIRTWLIGRGFGNSEATQESAWITTINHGFISSRTGNTVYTIIK